MESALTVIVKTVFTQDLLPEWSMQGAVGTNLLSVNSLTWNQRQNFLVLLTQKTSDASKNKLSEIVCLFVCLLLRKQEEREAPQR